MSTSCMANLHKVHVGLLQRVADATVFLLFEKLHFIFNNLMMNKRYSIAVYLVSMDGIVSAIQGIPQLKFSASG